MTRVVLEIRMMSKTPTTATVIASDYLCTDVDFDSDSDGNGEDGTHDGCDHDFSKYDDEDVDVDAEGNADVMMHTCVGRAFAHV